MAETLDVDGGPPGFRPSKYPPVDAFGENSFSLDLSLNGALKGRGQNLPSDINGEGQRMPPASQILKGRGQHFPSDINREGQRISPASQNQVMTEESTRNRIHEQSALDDHPLSPSLPEIPCISVAVSAKVEETEVYSETAPWVLQDAPPVTGDASDWATTSMVASLKEGLQATIDDAKREFNRIHDLISPITFRQAELHAQLQSAREDLAKRRRENRATPTTVDAEQDGAFIGICHKYSKCTHPTCSEECVQRPASQTSDLCQMSSLPALASAASAPMCPGVALGSGPPSAHSHASGIIPAASSQAATNVHPVPQVPTSIGTVPSGLASLVKADTVKYKLERGARMPVSNTASPATGPVRGAIPPVSHQAPVSMTLTTGTTDLHRSTTLSIDEPSNIGTTCRDGYGKPNRCRG